MRTLLLLILNLIAYYLLAGTPYQPRFVNYSIKDGLPSTEIYETIEDNEGFLWIATDAGVARFDGYSFEVFNTKQGLQEDVIIDLYKDNAGRIWFVSLSKGLSYWNGNDIITYKFNERLLANLGPHNIIYSFYVSDNFDVYTTSEVFGLLKIDRLGNIEKNPFKESYSDSVGIYLHPIENNVIYEFPTRALYNDLGDNNEKFLCFSKTPNPLVVRMHQPNELLLNSNKGLYSTQVLEDEYYFNLGLLILKIDIRNSDSVSLLKLQNNALSFFKSDDRFLLCQEQEGIKIYGSLKDKKPVTTWLEGESIAHIYQDASGGMWFSSLLNGLYYLSKNTFKNILTPTSLSGTSILAIEVLKSGKAAVVYNDSKALDIISLDGKVQKWQIPLQKHQGVAGLQLFGDTILIKESGTTKSENKESFFLHNIYMGSERVSSIPKAHLLPVNGKKGYYHITNILSSVNWVNSQTTTTYPTKNRIRVIDAELGSQERIWIASSSGLWLFQDSILSKYDSKVEPLNARINQVKAVEAGLIVASQDYGIGIVMNDTFYFIDENIGLASNRINTIDYSKDQIWCGSNSGLSRIKIHNWFPFEYDIQNYNLSENLISNEVSFLKVSDSLIYTGTDKGFFIINYKDRVQRLNDPPQVHFIDSGNTVVATKHSPRKFHYQQAVEISFTGISFASFGKIRYRYRLKNTGDNWIYTDLRSVRYDHLTYGNYIFEIAARNKEGVWSDSKSFYFSVAYPFWLEGKFLGISTIILASSLWLIFYQRKKARERRVKLKFDLLKAEQRALQAQMNPHFMFNTLNSIQAFSVANDQRKTAKYFSDFSELLRKALQNSGFNQISLRDEIDTLKIYLSLENMRFNNEIKMNIEIDPDLDLENTLIPPMILQPVLENAIWHGLSSKIKDKNLSLTFKWNSKNNELASIVQDNGIGRSAASSKKRSGYNSIGLENVISRLKLLNKYYKNSYQLEIIDLMDNEGNATGTRVELKIKQKH